MTNDFNQEQDSQQLFNDLLVLSRLSSEKVKALGDRLEQHSGFLSVERLAVEAFPESEEAGAVERLVLGLSPSAIQPLIEMVEQWRNSDERAKGLMTDERFLSLREKLPLLVRRSPAITRTRKAGALQTVTGNEIMGVMFVCDARPVYNERRDDIDGYVPLATMKILYQRQNADSEEIEFVLTPEEIDLLIERAQQARGKIQVLNRKMGEWLPNGTAGCQS